MHHLRAHELRIVGSVAIGSVIATSLLVPFELYELVLHPTVWKTGGILINLLIVLYLALSLRRRLAR